MKVGGVGARRARPLKVGGIGPWGSRISPCRSTHGCSCDGSPVPGGGQTEASPQLLGWCCAERLQEVGCLTAATPSPSDIAY